jgi:hypothetical protein
VDLEEAVIGVRLARQQRLELALRRLVAQRGERGFRVAASSNARSMARTRLIACSSRVRSRISACALPESDQRSGFSAAAFSSSSRRSALSQSKMPPQQRERLLDFVDQGL